MQLVPNYMDVFILAGGLGTRLSSCIPDTPKCLAPINRRYFLDILMGNLCQFGFKRFILCVGYLKDQVINHFAEKTNFNIDFSVEDMPLGTGGALKNAFDKIRSESFIVLNGDSICNLNYLDMVNFHIKKKAAISIALTEVKEPFDYGSIILDRNCRVVTFQEKAAITSRWVNAGVYVFGKAAVEKIYTMQSLSFSLELDFFPEAIEQLPAYGFKTSAKLWDIGTPERYEDFCLNYSS